MTAFSDRTPPVTLLILNWNAGRFLAACLDSLQQLTYPAYSVLLVDNGSSDGSPAFVRAHYPWVDVVETGVNAGFAGGNNVGLRRVQTPFVVLVNPDVIVEPDWLTQLIQPMLQNQAIGIVGCKVFYAGGHLLQHAGGYITFPLGLPGHYGLQEEDSGRYDEASDVEYVIGAAMAIRREVIDHIGLMDEGFFLYYDDVDYCVRARQAGFRVVYAPAARIIHLESATTQKGSAFYFQHMHASRWRYILKYYPVADILQATLPAERSWLLERSARERLGLARAYLHTLRQLPALWQQRFSDATQNAANDFCRVSAGLADLRNRLWAPSA